MADVADESHPQVSWDLAKYLDNLGSRMDAGMARIEVKLDLKADKADLVSMNTKLDLKADKADLAGIETRLEEHGKEIGKMKDRQREDEAAQLAVSQAAKSTVDSRQRRINVAMSFALVAVSLLGVLAAVFHW